MRSSIFGTCIAVALSFAGAQAHAAALDFTGTLALQIATLAPTVIGGSGVAVVNGSGGTGHLTQLAIPSSPFATTVVQPVTDPGAFPIMGVQVTAHNGTGAFAGSGGAGFGGTMPVLGVAKVCLFGPCEAAITNLDVPLTVLGQGGTATAMGPVNLTVYGAPWTTATAWVGSVTAMGGVSPLSNTGAPSGTVTLVTPVFIRSDIGASAVVPVFGFLTLHFVPEPGTLALFGAGVALLVAFGRRRPND